MIFSRTIVLLAVLLGLSGCASKFRTYNGPEVTQIYVMKGQRQMYLMHGTRALKTYDIALGFAPTGDKQIEGDGKTPEGTYYIDRRNPDSRFHLSLGVSYPNQYDVAEAAAMGKSPGGDIFIHGRGPSFKKAGKGTRADWTWGCIALTDREVEEVYSMIRKGTPITILP